MKKIWFISIAISIVALTRFLPHPPNFTALGALALFSGAMYKNRFLALSIPLAVLFITDLVLNNLILKGIYSSFILLTPGAIYLYGSLVLIAAIGFLTNANSPKSILGSGILASVLFFLISNFGVWASGTMYPPTFEGLLASYTMAIPFFAPTAASQLVYSAVLFGAYAVLSPKFKLQSAE